MYQTVGGGLVNGEKMKMLIPRNMNKKNGGRPCGRKCYQK